ncbi:MAG: glycosyltransferase family 9 protein [Proteobacteria bacterium]|nr:glycosyltransferase family 9 protein [Pseudomonadota bacterium]
MTTPTVRALAKAEPKTEIHFLTQVPSDQILRHNPYLSRVILYPPREKIKEVVSLIRRLRKERYSVVLDFLGLPKTAVLGWLTGAPLRIGFERRGRSPFYSHPVVKRTNVFYSALQKIQLLSTLNIDSTDAELDFFIDEKDRRAAREIIEKVGVEKDKTVVSISPVSRRNYKIWSSEKFAGVCDFLVEKYSVQILFLWGPGEYHFVEAVRKKMRCPSLPDYDIPTIGETVALLERVDLHVGNDNGPMHFAIAAGIPTVAVFGRPLSRNWTPPGSTRNLAVEYDPGCKENCFYPKCELECIKNLEVGPVIEKVDYLMKRLLQ